MTSVYQKYGIEPIINACGTVTRLGGAPMPPDVLRAFHDAASQSVPLEALQASASVHIARITRTEAALVTAGSAAALTLGAAAILTGNDLKRMEQLPDCADIPCEMVIARDQRSGYDHAVRASGARLIDVGFNEIVSGVGVRRTEAWEYESAFGATTAGVVYVYSADSHPPLEEVVEVAHRHGLPVLVDAAAELPPCQNLWEIPATGADLVAFSGGKAIRGPQSTGILCGRGELISAAALQMLDMDEHFELWEPPAGWIDKQRLGGIPRHGIGRGLKVSKEEIIALLTALDLFVDGVYDKDLAHDRQYLQTLAGQLSAYPVTCRILDTEQGARWPTLEMTIDETVLGRNALEVCRRLRRGAPAIYVGASRLARGQLTINPVCLDEESRRILCVRLEVEFDKPSV